VNKTKSLCYGLAVTLALAACPQKEKQPAPVRSYAMRPILRIPVQIFLGDTASAALLQNPGALTIALGDTDALPQGPESFDILHDGGFVIADPLRQRLVFYDSAAVYIEAWPLGFPADGVALVENGDLEVRHATTGEYYLVDDSRQPRPITSSGRGSRSAAVSNEAEFTPGAKRGQILNANGRGGSGALEVNFSSDSLSLISLESLGTDARGFTYAVLETTPGGSSREPLRIQKFVRKYAADGVLVGQILDIAIDYYVTPEDDLRLREEVVYQLMPLQDEVQIRKWDTR